MSIVKRHPTAAYFVFAFAFSWLLAGLMIARHNGLIDLPDWLHYLVAWGPAISASLGVALTQGRAGVRSLIMRLVQFRIGLQGWLYAVVAPLLMLAVAVLVSWLASGTMPDLSQLGYVDYLGNIGIPAAMLLWVFSFGFGEEIGWRGYAQENIEGKRGFLFTVLLIGVIWAFWHIPFFFYKDTYMAMGLASFPFFIVTITPGAIVLGWIYTRTKSLLAVGLWHGLFDFGTASAVDGGTVAMVMSILVMVWALAIVVMSLRTARAHAYNPA